MPRVRSLWNVSRVGNESVLMRLEERRRAFGVVVSRLERVQGWLNILDPRIPQPRLQAGVSGFAAEQIITENGIWCGGKDA